MEKPKKGNRKWTASETRLILQYIREQHDFERPTAQVFYTKCLENTKIDATWNLLRWKLRYLRTTFKKAEEWRKSTQAVSLENSKSFSIIKEKLHKICPHYNILKEIFGEIKNKVIYEDSETESSTVTTPRREVRLDSCYENGSSAETVGNFSQIKEENISWDSYEISTLPMATVTTTTASSHEKDKQLIEEHEIDVPKNTMNLMTIVQREKNEIQKLKIRLKSRKHDKDIELNEKKLKIEEMNVLEKIARRKQEMKIRQQELDLKKMEIEKDERLRRLEIEKQERLEKYEIEMRYKCSK